MDVYQRRRLVALSALAVVFIAVVLLIKSCGGDDEETPVTPLGASGASGATGASVISQADYIDQGDAICLDSNTVLANVDQSDPTQAAKDEADAVSGELQQLQSLPQPDDGTTKLGNFLNALEKQAAAYQDRATAIERGDETTATDLESTIDKAGDEAANAAENFGFKACGNPDKVGSSSSGGTDTSSGGGADETTTTTPTDTGGTVTPTTTTPIPTTPTTTVPAAPAPTPPADTSGGGATPTPPTDTGGDTGSGGTSSGGVSP